MRDLLLLYLLIPLAAAALQQQPYYRAAGKYTDHVPDAIESPEARWRSSSAPADSIHTPADRRASHGRSERDVNIHIHNKVRTSHNERALATVSPAELDAAVGAPPAQRPVSTAGLASRQPARSLQDWQVEDLMLLATVDGKLHARDRRTGAPKWTLEVEREMVETIRHRDNKTVDDNGMEVEDPLFIVEPSQDGRIFIFIPGLGLQRLGYTVRQLAELAPYASEGFPAVAYTAEKKNTLYTVDAATGHILRTHSAAGSIVNDDRSCRRVNILDSLEEEECESIGTLTLGRTEYIIGIQDRDTGEPINTLRYFEWGPNNRDNDLRSKYTNTMDNKYVYTKFDGTIFGLDTSPSTGYFPVSAGKPIYRHKFASPVVRVFDIVRPQDDYSSDAALVILPQPTAPSRNEFDGLEEDTFENVFVNCTVSGNWYAMSEMNYPTVTDGASTAKVYNDGTLHVPSSKWPVQNARREQFAGVHHLMPQGGQRAGALLIDGDSSLTLDPPPEDNQDKSPAPAVGSQPALPAHAPAQNSTLSLLVVIVMTALCVVGIGAGFKFMDLPLLKSRLQSPVTIAQVPEAPAMAVQTEAMATKIRDGEPAHETIFPHNEVSPAPKVSFADTVGEAPLADRRDSDPTDVDEESPKNEVEQTKKPATRGRRGGKKQKEKALARAEARAKKGGSPNLQGAEIISIVDSESPAVTGPLQINSLIIQTDRVIGQGSCGTIVFEGSFEGRDVAVKRMLSQYYELASQEVSFLQQSDDHPNVVRYFCQQRDDHFLYIAVELCQASLYEVWEADKAKTEYRQRQLRALKFTIQQNMTRSLQQLTAGLCHLHKLRIIHRDIKPQNILVAFPKRTQPNDTRLVISDFGLGKNLPENVSTLIDPTGNAGTAGWKAPELISQPRESEGRSSHNSSSHNGSDGGIGGTSGVKRAADIFSLGCLFFWVLTDGVHPFEDENGWQQMRELNIKRGHKNMEPLARWSDSYEPMQLISWMLEYQPEDRPTAHTVLNHPFFWSPEKRLAFLCDVSDHFEREPRGTYEDGYAGDSPHLCLLEDCAPEVISGPDFLAKLDRHFVDTLGKQRKYSGYRLLDLLRALRNKKNHYEDMSEDVKKRVGPLPHGYLNYWSQRFPRLLMACHSVIVDAGLVDSDRFRGYFGEGL